MSTNARIIVKVRKGETLKANVENFDIPVCSFDDRDRELSQDEMPDAIEATGAYAEIYVHWDGYIEAGVGECLFSWFNDHAKAKNLIALGDCSEVCDRVVPYFSRGCEIYEENMPRFKNRLTGQKAEYEYYYDGNRWLVRTDDTDFEPLENFIE